MKRSGGRFWLILEAEFHSRQLTNLQTITQYLCHLPLPSFLLCLPPAISRVRTHLKGGSQNCPVHLRLEILSNMANVTSNFAKVRCARPVQYLSLISSLRKTEVQFKMCKTFHHPVQKLVSEGYWYWKWCYCPHIQAQSNNVSSKSKR